ncbi:hypothetical protein [Pseudoroseomonas sp. WGS1072]|uniref:hypothetical protein n=1 Tax=Roseomonas sp. WGS1072 TaxID=3366816 RepID=UPI003BEFEF9F
MTAHDDHHLELDLDDEDAMPGPNFLAQFRAPMTDEDWDDVVRTLEQAIVEWLAETETMVSDNQTDAESPSSTSTSNEV